MSTGDPQAGPGGPASEEAMRAAYEAELKKVRIEQILLGQIADLYSLGLRRTGLQPGTEDERDLGQVKLAIDSMRALIPLVEAAAGPQIGQIREALSQLQLAYVRLGGTPAGGEAAAGPAGPEQPTGPAPGPSAAPGPEGTSPSGQAPPPSPAAEPGAAETPAEPGEPGPAQRSGRLWVPGQ